MAGKVEESNSKIHLLGKSWTKYSDLNINPVKEDDDYNIVDNKPRKTGRLKFRIIGASSLATRKSSKEEIQAKIKVDGSLMFSSRLSKNKWDENVDVQGMNIFLI